MTMQNKIVTYPPVVGGGGVSLCGMKRAPLSVCTESDNATDEPIEKVETNLTFYSWDYSSKKNEELKNLSWSLNQVDYLLVNRFLLAMTSKKKEAATSSGRSIDILGHTPHAGSRSISVPLLVSSSNRASTFHLDEKISLNSLKIRKKNLNEIFTEHGRLDKTKESNWCLFINYSSYSALRY